MHLFKMNMNTKPIINVIEIDSKDVRYQTGIERYMNILRDNMPKNIFTFRIIFYRASDCTSVSIKLSDNELSIVHPQQFAAQCLYPAIITLLRERLEQMTNLIVKSNCLGFEGLVYAIRSSIYCKTIGVLHCVPSIMPHMMQSNPLFGMDHIITVCDSTKPWLSAIKNNRPVSLIHNGIDRPVISKKTADKNDAFRFIFANGLAAHKGFAKIIPAIRRVAAQHKIEVFVLGGSDEAGDKLLEANTDLPIKYVGLLTDDKEIAKYYQMADCALFASDSEACSFAGIEAMAYNLPIISTNAPGLYEMFGPNAALYVAMDANAKINPDEYATQMIRIIDEPKLRRQLSIKGYARYLSQYTARQMVSTTVALYNKLITQ